jgi:hypothetical protein
MVIVGLVQHILRQPLVAQEVEAVMDLLAGQVELLDKVILAVLEVLEQTTLVVAVAALALLVEILEHQLAVLGELEYLRLFQGLL